MRPGKPTIFDLELRPNRPLSPRQARLLLVGVAGAFVLMGLRFAWLGAWPVLPFLLVDILLLGWAMRAARRAGQVREHLRLDADALELVRIAPLGKPSRLLLEPAFTSVELERLGADNNRLWLKSGARRIPLGSFLSPEERTSLSWAINHGLARWRMNRA